MTDQTEPPAVGVYENVPMETYNRWDCARSSTLFKLTPGGKEKARSPSHLRRDILKDRSSSAKGMGSALHLAYWEPGLYQSRVEVWTKTKTRVPAFKNREAELPDGHYLLTVPEAAAVPLMVASLKAKKIATQYLHAITRRELSIVFEIETSEGLKLLTKARLDGYAPGLLGGTIADLKSCKDASESDFAWSIRNYGYSHQAAIYREAAHAADLPAENHVILAVENEGYHETAVYRLDDADIADARRELEPAINTMAKCYDTGIWPAYPERTVDIKRAA